MINHRRAVPGRRVRPYSPFGHGEAQDAAQISRFGVCESTFSVYSQSQLQASSASRLGPSQPKKLRPLRFGGIWLQEVVERAGGSSADGMQHFSGLMGWVPRSGPTCSEGRSSSSRRSGRGGLHVCAEGQTAVIAVKLLHSEGRASGPLRRRSAALEKKQ